MSQIHAVNGEVPDGPGLFEVNGHDPGKRFITNVRKIAGRTRTPRTPGSVLIAASTVLLAILGGGCFYVSWWGQYLFIWAVKHQDSTAMVQAGLLDAGMIILSGLSLGLARQGKPARAERVLIQLCAIGSAAMNYLAADDASPRSVIVYTAAPIFGAIITDRVVSVVRRHALGITEESAWRSLGLALLAAARIAGMLALYWLRFVLAPKSTAKGVRRMVLDAAPVPGVIEAAAEQVPAAGLGPCPVHGIVGCPFDWCMVNLDDGMPCARSRPCPEHDSGPPEYGFETPAEDRCAADIGTGQACGRSLPCTEHPAIMPPDREAPPAFGSKREAFEWHYRRHPQFGDRQAMSPAAKEVGERVGLQWGTSRTYAAAILAADAISEAMDAARECEEEAQ